MKAALLSLPFLLLPLATGTTAAAEPAAKPAIVKPAPNEAFDDNVFLTVARTADPRCADNDWQVEWQWQPPGAEGADWQPWKYAVNRISCFAKAQSAMDFPRDLFDPAPARYRVRVRLAADDGAGPGEWSDWRTFTVVYPKSRKPPPRH